MAAGYVTDSNGDLVCSGITQAEFDAETWPAGHTWSDTYTYVDPNPDQTFIDYCEAKKCAIDNATAGLYWTAVTGPGYTLLEQAYLMLAHLIKNFQALSVINQRDSPVLPEHPELYTDDGAGNRKHEVIEKEAAKRGITDGALADIIKPLALQNMGLIADCEQFRSPAKDDIDVERDRETVPGTKDNDYAAVDAIYNQFLTDLASIGA